MCSGDDGELWFGLGLESAAPSAARVAASSDRARLSDAFRLRALLLRARLRCPVHVDAPSTRREREARWKLCCAFKTVNLYDASLLPCP